MMQKMSKVVFIVPESSHLITPKVHPPLGVLYLAAVLRDKHEVEVLDLAGARNPSKIISEIDADYVCITATTPQFPAACAINEELPEKSISVIGGVHITHIPTDGFPFSIIVRGEGERAIKEIVDTCAKRGVYQYSEVTNIDTIPFPDRSAVDIHSYKYEIDGIPATTAITCYDDITEVLTIEGWKCFEEITYNDKVATLNPHSKELEYQNPSRIIVSDYNGEMIHIKSEQIDLFVTPNHELYVDLRMSGKWSGFTFLSASRLSEISVLSRMIKGGVTWLGVEREFFELPSITYRKNQFSTGQREVLRIPMDLWLEFFGYYISEGNSTFNKANNGYIIQISQDRASPYYNDIKVCLEQLGFNFCYASSAFQISNKQLYDYLISFGKSADKFIPSYILSLSRRQLRILFDALMKGDGCLSRNSYYTVSKRLMDNIQEIALKIGMCGNIKVIKNLERQGYGYSDNAYSMVINKVKLIPSIKNYGKTRKRGYISNEMYVGKVYCCEVPNHLIYVRRNGVPIWSGNSRGCPYACAFCSTIWQKVRFHSAEYVLKELTEIQSYGFNAVNFFDDVFTLKRERLKTICGGLKARKMSWRCFITGNTVTKGMLSLMAKSGCKEVAIGIESGSDRILHAVHKCSTSEKNKKAIQMAHDAGLQVKGFFIIGLPRESKDTIAETEAFINECPCDDYDFSLLSVLPNSDIYRNHDKYDLIRNTSKSDYSKMWYKGTPGMYEATEATISLSTIELTEIRDKLEKKYKPEAKLK